MAEEQTVEELRQQLADERKGRLQAVEENKVLITDRDGFKTQAQTLTDEKAEIERKKLLENGEFQAVAETSQAEVTRLEGVLSDASTEKEALAAKVALYEERDKLELAKLLELVPENLRETISGDGISIEKQLALAKTLANQKQPGPGYKPPGQQQESDLPAQHAQALKDGNMPLALEIKRKMYEENN